MRQVLFVPIIGSGRGEDAFRADLDDANGMVSASIGSILKGDRRGQPKHDWTLVRADLPDQRNVPILRPESLRDFDAEMPASDKAKLPDFVQDKRSYRSIVMEMLGRQYDYADERMLDIFIERAIGHSRIAGGAHGSGFVVDHFTDTDGTLLESHSPDTGGSWEKLGFAFDITSASTSNADIQSNQLEGGSNKSPGYRNAATPSSAEYVLTVTKRIGAVSGSFGSANDATSLAGRVSSSGTAEADVDYYVFAVAYWNNSGGARLRKHLSGSDTDLATTNPFSLLSTETTYEMVFDVADALKEGSITGVFTLDTTDNDITQVGRVGIGSAEGDQGSWQDDFLAEEVSIEITSVTPSKFADSDTSVTIAGSGFEASQGTGKVELGDSSDYATATLVAQTVTSWSDTSIDFTVVQGALSSGTVYVFVTNDSGNTTAGFAVTLQKSASGTAAIAVIADPSATGTKQASGSAALATVAATNATGSKQGDGAASLAAIAATAATGSKQTSGAAQLAVIAATSGGGGKQTSGAAALAVIAATAASGSGSEAVIGTAAITVIAALAASGAKHETGAAAIVVTVSLSALGSSPGEALLYRGQQGQGLDHPQGRGLPTGKATI